MNRQLDTAAHWLNADGIHHDHKAEGRFTIVFAILHLI